MIYDDFLLLYDILFIYENSFRTLRTMSKTIYGCGFYLLGPFGLIQFYFLFSGRELAGIGGRNGGQG
jgi:hypothetical protein